MWIIFIVTVFLTPLQRMSHRYYFYDDVTSFSDLLSFSSTFRQIHHIWWFLQYMYCDFLIFHALLTSELWPIYTTTHDK
jgi:hypothetical protein